MTTKTAKAEMLQAHEAIAAALDAKLGNMPEWKAFRHLDRALLALETEGTPPAERVRPIVRRRLHLNGAAPPSYMALADQALTETAHPITTLEMIEYIGKHRALDDFDKARAVIQSSLSKNERFESVPWRGRRGWWFRGRAVPAEK